MRNRSKLILASLGATLLMSLAVTTASATHLRASDHNFRITWSALRLTEEGGGTIIECPVTIEGTFHSATIAKTSGSLIGYVTRATVNNAACTGGTVTVSQASLPWHVSYEGFSESLPNIRTIEVLLRNPNFALTVTILGIRVTCGYGRPGERVEGRLNREASGALASLTPGATARLLKLSGSEACPPTGGFAGDSQRPVVLGATTAITVTLI